MSSVTKWVMDLLDRWWISSYLSEGLGGKGRLDFELGQGEEVEFVLPRPPFSMWVKSHPFPDPRLEEGSGYPPLLVWAILPAYFLEFLVGMGLFFLRALWPEALTDLLLIELPTLVLVACGIFLVPVYWFYEWCRRHEYWFQTIFEGYLVCFRPFGRMTVPRSPVEWMKETRVSSLWADRGSPLA